MYFIKNRQNINLAYQFHKPENYATKTGVVFLHGFKSDMEGAKACFLHEFCREKSLPFLRFDCRGHGNSQGNFLDCGITDWADDVAFMLEMIMPKISNGKYIIIGSSMGGWLMLLASLQDNIRHNVQCLIGLAAAPDFTEELIWKKLPPEHQQKIRREGVFNLETKYCQDPSHDEYLISKNLIEQGRSNLLLAKEGDININCPVELIHGMQDEDVPYEFSINLGKKLRSGKVNIHLVKDANHRFSEGENLQFLARILWQQWQSCGISE